MGVRLEKDSMGVIEVSNDVLWGAQTQRSLEHFKIGRERFDPRFIECYALTKLCAARVNGALGEISAAKSAAIETAASQVARGEHPAEFPLVVWQTGSGTQTNMNVNEVIAAIANREHPGLAIHPNDDVNRGQSTNDTFPTVMHVYLARLTKEKLLPSVKLLRQAFERKADAYRDLVKIGRTHLMDATPLTVGQELSAFAAQLAQAERQLEQALDGIMDLAIGGTAVGTGINAHPEFGARVARALAHETGLPFRAAPNKFAMLAGHEAVLALSAAARTLAVACFKIASDIRLLASGPRCGLGEWILPANEPGSSIMPGKVNPTQCEAMTQVAAHVFGLDASVAFAATQGHLQLNVFKPLLVRNIGEALGLMADTCESFRAHCVEGMIPDQETIARHLERSLMLVTALTPLIGYEASARIAKTAHQSGMTLREAALASGQVTAEDFDRVVRADLMVGPR